MKLLIVLGIILIVYLIISRTKYSIKSNPVGWYNNEPAQYLESVIDYFGEPKYIIQGIDGLAYWGPSQLTDTPFVYLELKDELLYDNSIGRNTFFYAVVQYESTPSKVQSVLSLSKGIIINAAKHQLIARSDSYESSIVLLSIATAIGNGKYTLKYAKENQLVEKSLQGLLNPESYKVVFSDSYKRLLNNLAFKPELKI